MNTDINHKTIWDEGARAGFILGLATVVFLAANILCSQIKDTNTGLLISGILGILIWGGKLFTCILLLYKLMKNFAEKFKNVSRNEIIRFGAVVALCSALITSAAMLLYYSVINPDFIENALNAEIASMSSMLDSNTLDALENLPSSMPAILFFGNLIYCFLFGWIASEVLASRISSASPFNNNESSND